MELKAEASKNYMGMLWWVLEPLLYLVAFYVVFDVIMQRGGPGFVGFLLCGLVFWRWFDTTIKRCGNSIVGNASLINQIYLPKIVFPLIELVGCTMRFLIILLLFLVFARLYSGQFYVTWLYLPLLMLCELLLIVGLGFLMSVLTPLNPDLRKVIDNCMFMMFYLSGIFFDISRLSPAAQEWLYLNPMAVIIRQMRLVVLSGEPPEWNLVLRVVVAGLVLSVLGVLVLRRVDRKLVHYVS